MIINFYTLISYKKNLGISKYLSLTVPFPRKNHIINTIKII